MGARSYLISAIRFMKACPSQVVLAHSQPARIIANVFVVGYEIFKDQMKEKIFLSPNRHLKAKSTGTF